jgi:two-component system sensor histidine kinase BaeS
MSARLKSNDERRRDFLADVVHELRTPLAVIRAEAEAIQDGVHPADEEHLAPIIDATRSLEVLVEDLRALALTDTGSLALHREPVDPRELARDAVAAFETQAEAAGVTLTSTVPDGLPAIDADPARMRSALGNVIANAIRHTPKGGSVTVNAAQSAQRVTIEVSDTGEGIAPDLLPHVFERFVRGPHSRGTGLGLAIAHDIVVAQGGEIEARSTVGLGTVMRMSVPIAR